MFSFRSCKATRPYSGIRCLIQVQYKRLYILSLIITFISFIMNTSLYFSSSLNQLSYSLLREVRLILASQFFSISFISLPSLWDLIGSPSVFCTEPIFVFLPPKGLALLLMRSCRSRPCWMGNLGIRVMHQNAVWTDGFHQLLVVFQLRCDSLTSVLLVH